LLKVYPICRWSGDLGPKVNKGDRQAPEGFYTITPGLNPDSNYYLAINTGFPNAYDRANDRHGTFHNSWRLLCARLLRHDRRADRQNLFAGARIVPRRPAVIPDPGLSVLAAWKMLKIGNDHFEETAFQVRRSAASFVNSSLGVALAAV
jgi:hypothetical protein